MIGQTLHGHDTSDATNYNIEQYVRGINAELRRAFREQPVLRVGQTAPLFNLPALDGGTHTLEELRRERNVALIFGSLSAPPCVEELPALDRLADLEGHLARFVFVYTREAHPGELLPAHRSMEQKLAQAQRLRDRLDVQMLVCADDLLGTTHLRYGGLPFMAVVVNRDRVLVYRAEWAQADELRWVLENLARHDRLQASGVEARVSYSESLRYSKRTDPETFDRLLGLAGTQR